LHVFGPNGTASDNIKARYKTRNAVDSVDSSSLWLIGTVRAEPETVISRAWVQSPDPAEEIVSRLLARML